MRFERAVWAVLLACLLWGCGATVHVLEPEGAGTLPGGANAVRLERISGADGESVRRAAEAALRRSSGYAEDPGRAALILSGRVHTEMEDVEGRDLVVVTRPTGEKAPETVRDPFVDREFTVERPLTESVQTDTPYVVRRAGLRLVYDLAGPDGNLIRDGARIEVREERKYGGVNEQSRFGRALKDLPAREDTVARLAGLLAEKLVRRLYRYRNRFDLDLDRGRGLWGEREVRRGVDLARDGQWDEAVKVWQGILADNPEHPSALYNVGLAYERLGGRENLERAGHYYTRAVKLGDGPHYREALTRTMEYLKEMGSSAEK